ncbi:lipoyl(octanoyl) transferase LipB [Williamsia sp. CHRR-6]|uniref:lipoyl(octanoyl) transferase LipB n=1 Tax=Williamsia sp. CHRR-6 TaxID=2835871 RepID=UPI001BD9345E|nr:lipoyl(octanoyl) transferase LipB [Williamsia sp. CHRR-6]MBT0565320.1 lipoyl(octanoyl) transferase LipB [Williamsia sp. CHRR-6]
MSSDERRPATSARRDPTDIEVRQLGVVDYADAFAEQHRLAAERAEGTLDHDVLLMLEHPPVYTAGRRTAPEDRPVDDTPVVDVDRGGKITWHGPGQLVGYPIVALAEPLDVVDYVRRIEEAMISACAGVGVVAVRVADRSGAWVLGDPAAGTTDRKVGAIGIRVAKGVALHGFALNCNPDLTAFSAIVPCGIPDAGVTSLSTELGRAVTVAEITESMARAVIDALDGRLPVVPTASGTTTTATAPQVLTPPPA